MTDARQHLTPGSDHPITLEKQSSSRVVVQSGSVAIAQTDRAIEIREASYLPVLYVPLEDVDQRLLRRSEHRTWCPYKGEASYYDIVDGDGGDIECCRRLVLRRPLPCRGRHQESRGLLHRPGHRHCLPPRICRKIGSVLWKRDVAEHHTGSESASASARERLLEAADELFYTEGVQTVGIDRIIERAGVAKASLYNVFGSKEGLVAAYLASRHDRTTGRLTGVIERVDDPRQKILAVFDSQADSTSTDFNGCAFIAASTEAPQGGLVEQAADQFRGWILAMFTDLAEQAGVLDRFAPGHQLYLIYDGAGVAGRMDHHDRELHLPPAGPLRSSSTPRRRGRDRVMKRRGVVCTGDLPVRGNPRRTHPEEQDVVLSLEMNLQEIGRKHHAQ